MNFTLATTYLFLLQEMRRDKLLPLGLLNGRLHRARMPIAEPCENVHMYKLELTLLLAGVGDSDYIAILHWTKLKCLHKSEEIRMYSWFVQ